MGACATPTAPAAAFFRGPFPRSEGRFAPFRAGSSADRDPLGPGGGGTTKASQMVSEGRAGPRGIGPPKGADFRPPNGMPKGSSPGPGSPAEKRSTGHVRGTKPREKTKPPAARGLGPARDGAGKKKKLRALFYTCWVVGRGFSFGEHSRKGASCWIGARGTFFPVGGHAFSLALQGEKRKDGGPHWESGGPPPSKKYPPAPAGGGEKRAGRRNFFGCLFKDRRAAGVLVAGWGRPPSPWL